MTKSETDSCGVKRLKGESFTIGLGQEPACPPTVRTLLLPILVKSVIHRFPYFN
ncbi:hypothetical protein [Siminovitchia fordii]|uniref:hypothetical protein n=1 Tax=Siminovitchia fordii TaxID=254759 RepID=UPI0003A628F0|nr:hypothetical protein [Siminovitchia fordii]